MKYVPIPDKNIPGPAMSGRFVIVQMDNGGDVLNLKEVKAFGRPGNFTKNLYFWNEEKHSFMGLCMDSFF